MSKPTILLLVALPWTVALARQPGSPPADPLAPVTAQEPEDAQALLAQAEALVAEGSWGLALPLYERARGADPAPETARWIEFRLADAGWRAAAARGSADPTDLERARERLEQLVAANTPVEDRVGAELHESLGDFLWTRPGAADFHSALAPYRAALDWWAAAEDLELARGRWLAIVWRLARPAWFEPSRAYGSWGNWVPVDLLEDAVRAARSAEDLAHARFLLARTLATQRYDAGAARRAREAFEGLLAEGRETPWYDDALFHYAEWLEQRGPWVHATDGSFGPRPDWAAAAELYRRLVREFPAGTSAYARVARERAERIVRPELSVQVESAFLPGSAVAYRLAWRNLERVDLELYRVSLERDLDLVDPDVDPWRWVSALDLGASEPVRRWTHVPEPPADGERHRPRDEILTLDPAPGPGAYVLVARARGLEGRELVLVSDTSLVAKASGSRVLLWATDALRGAPLAEGQVTLWARCDQGRGRLRWSARRAVTASDGTAHFELDAPCVGAGLVATFESGERTAFALLWSPSFAPQEGWRVYATTDRAAYRPDQTVHWKVLARQHDGRDWRTPAGEELRYVLRDPRGAEVERATVALSDFGSAHGQLRTRPEMALGEYTVTFERAADGASVGSATLFRLEEYQLPEFEVRVAPLAAENGRRPVLGEEVGASLDASYYFGGPVAGADAEVVVYQRPVYDVVPLESPGPEAWFARSLRAETSFRPWPVGPGSEVHREHLVLDAEGRASVRFETPFAQGGAFEYTIEARVTDASRREVVGSGTLRVLEHPYRVQVGVEHAVHAPRDPVEATLAASDADGAPVDAEGVVTLLRTHWVETWFDPAGREVAAPTWLASGDPAPPGWRRARAEEAEEEVQRTTLRTGPEGRGTWRLTPPGQGSYVVRWTSEVRTGVVRAEARFWVADEGSRELGTRRSGVDLVLDRNAVRAGATTPIVVLTEASGRHVLLTVETEELLEWRVLAMDGTARLLNLPVGAQHVPNAFVAATLVADGVVHEAVRELVVAPLERFLEVELATDRETYRPGDAGEIAVFVRDAHGEPVEAELEVALVDESVAAIQEDYAGDPRAFFYGTPRPRGVQTASTAAALPYARLERDAAGQVVERRQGGRAGSDEFFLGQNAREGRSARADSPAPSASKARSEALAAEPAFDDGASGALGAVRVRADFRETALYEAALRTDAEGRARLPVAFPDSTTRWRASVRTCDRGARFGQSVTSPARTTMPLVLRMAAPRFFVVGDEVVLSATVLSHVERPLTLAVECELEGLELLGRVEDGALVPGAGATIALGPCEERRVDWRVRARSPGLAVVTMRAAGDGEGDAVRRTYPVEAHGIEALVARAGALEEDEVAFDLELPEARASGSTLVELRLAPSVAVAALDALPYLVHYPYGCTEQTLSRFVPAAIVVRTLSELGLSAELVAARAFGGVEPGSADATHPDGGQLGRLDEVARAGLARIESFQRPDGGWGWWPGGEPDVYMSAYALWSLTLAREAGLEPSPNAMALGAHWLALRLVELEGDGDLAAWVLHALAAYRRAGGAVDEAALARAFDALWPERGRLAPCGLALFARAAHDLGRADEAAALARNLASGATVDEDGTSRTGSGAGGRAPRTVHWGAGGPARRWAEGGVESTALALRALVAIDPRGELVRPAVRWLVANRRAAQWNSTRDTALAVLGLSEYLATSGELGGTLAYEVEVDGVRVATGELGPDDALGAPRVVRLPGERARQRVRIRRTGGEGVLYWSLGARFFSEEEPVEPRGNGLFVRRDYYRLVGRPTLLRGEVFERVPLVDGGAVESGDRIEVVLTVEAKNDLEYLVFQDRKPAGFEAVELHSGGPFHAYELRRDAWEPGGADPAGSLGGDRARATAGGTGRSRWVHRELRDREVALFVDRLPEGVWEMRYVLRAQSPGSFHALPLGGYAMYVPELRANGAECRVTISDPGPR